MLSCEKSQPEGMPNTHEITMDDLLSRTHNLSVLDEDGWEVHDEGRAAVEKLCAIGRLITNRPMSRSLLRTILGRVWGISEKNWGVEIKLTTKEAMFLVFSFKSTQDLNRILTKNPWFLNNGVGINKTGSGGQISSKAINKVVTRPFDSTIIEKSPGDTMDEQKSNSNSAFQNEEMMGKIDINGNLRLAMEACSEGDSGSDDLINDSYGPIVDQDPKISDYGRETPLNYDLNLIDIPISYATGLNEHIQEDSQKKRRKITPKRLKNKGFSSMATVGTQNVNEEGVTINSLLNEDGSWKINEVISWFHYDDVPWILGTIPSIHNSDSITWTLTSNGHYTVASGYKLRFSNPEIIGCSDTSQIKAWWTFIWGSHLTTKLKNFIWRVYNHWIPVKVELCKRGMNINTSCDWCKTQDETLCHALWLYLAVQNIWQQKPNDRYWIPWALEILDNQLRRDLQKPKLQKSQTKNSWQPPPIGKFLINLDASIRPDLSGCGINAIIRDHNGELIVAETRFFPDFLSVMLAETAAIQMGLDLALRWSCRDVLIGVDCQSVVNAIKNREAPHTDWGNIIQQILKTCCNFHTSDFIFSPRSCNKVANSLANWARVNKECNLWTDVMPSCATNSLLADLPKGC
ncbi:hypothetical protein G4B88_001072 [Cannabis sativa]|uniref:RNase H type-1 domain-containing protein n=1 Tax=Cannabis sativa TaxID=3483 RepID=A0A7J6EDW6_CANSA|nr:hypothetical protein G4B88_001072 [Cannabis sativa]